MPISPEAKAGYYFGYSVAVGNFDGTGYADIVAGAPVPSVYPYQPGSAYLFKGRKQFPARLTGQDARFMAPAPRQNRDWFGWSLAFGDINGDGYQDLLVGSPGPLPVFAGKGFLVLGSPNPTGDIEANYTFAPPGLTGNFVGNSVAIGDVNSDGFDDVLLDSRGYGNVYLYEGAANIDTGLDDTLQTPSQTDSQMGFSIAAGPVGYSYLDADVVAGAPLYDATVGETTYTDAGRIVVYQTEPDADSDGMDDRCDNCSEVPNFDQQNSDSIPITFTGWSNADLDHGVATPYTDYTIPSVGSAPMDYYYYDTDWQGDACQNGDDQDLDRDGRTNYDEIHGGDCGYTSNPLSMNSNQPIDLDIDSWHCATAKPITDPSGTTPWVSSVDSDGDGLPDVLEIQKYGTAFDNANSDGDDLSDGVEVFDVTGNGTVDGADAWSVCAAWNRKPSVSYGVDLDLDKNGVVNGLDMQWMNKYLTDHSKPAIACPTPP